MFTYMTPVPLLLCKYVQFKCKKTIKPKNMLHEHIVEWLLEFYDCTYIEIAYIIRQSFAKPITEQIRVKA